MSKEVTARTSAASLQSLSVVAEPALRREASEGGTVVRRARVSRQSIKDGVTSTRDGSAGWVQSVTHQLRGVSDHEGPKATVPSGSTQTAGPRASMMLIDPRRSAMRWRKGRR